MTINDHPLAGEYVLDSGDSYPGTVYRVLAVSHDGMTVTCRAIGRVVPGTSRMQYDAPLGDTRRPLARLQRWQP